MLAQVCLAMWKLCSSVQVNVVPLILLRMLLSLLLFSWLANLHLMQFDRTVNIIVVIIIIAITTTTTTSVMKYVLMKWPVPRTRINIIYQTN